MNPYDERPFISLPDNLDDEAVAALHAFFLEVANVIENHFAAQLRRHQQRPDPRQQLLWDDDPPF